jgi:hypothetical protein
LSQVGDKRQPHPGAGLSAPSSLTGDHMDALLLGRGRHLVLLRGRR